jgi:F-type H+-transporting ATPase subunit alpha
MKQSTNHTPKKGISAKNNSGFTVVVPEPLGQEELNQLAGKLTELMGQTPPIRMQVNPRLLAGLILRAGDTALDGTLNRQLKELQQSLSARTVEQDRVEAMRAETLLSELREAIEAYQPEPQMEDIGVVEYSGDGVARISGLSRARMSELVEFENGVLGMVLNLEDDHVGVIILGHDEEVRAGASVRLVGRIIDIPVGEGMLGRVVNAVGDPIDGRGPVQTSNRRPIESIAPGIAERVPVDTPLQTGIKTIDSIIPIGRGQRELIIGDRQTGKTALAIDTIINQKDTGVICIYVAIGQKNSTVAQVVDTLRDKGAMDYTVVVAATASDPVTMQYIAPYSGCAIGEEFMSQGKDVLIVYDDLSKHAVAYRTMSLLLRRPPGREAYPGDIFYLHSRLLERSARLSPALGGGSMTALPIVETLAGDISAYIPTNIISITDGQIFLETDLFFAGIRPAINVGLSVSRVGGAAQIPAMKKLAGPLKLQLAQYRDLASFAKFGAELDKASTAQLAKGERIVALLKQPRFSPLPVEEQVFLIYTMNNGGFDDVPVEEIPAYERKLLKYVKTHYSQVLKTIREQKKLDDALESAMQTAIAQAKASLSEDKEPASVG